MSPHVSTAFAPLQSASVVHARVSSSEHLFAFGPFLRQKLSRSVHGGVGLTGKSLTEHCPVRALPPSCAVQTPMSYRSWAVRLYCAMNEMLAVSPGNRHPWTPGVIG